MVVELKFDAKVPNFDRYKPERVDQATRATLYPAVLEATLLLEREVKMRTPVGATEAARGSIQAGTELVRGRHLEVRGTVTSALPYIVPLEKGSRPHWAPIAPLLLYCKRVYGDEKRAYALRGWIHKHGTKAAKMFEKGFEARQALLERILQQGVDAWVRRLRGR